MAGTYRVEIDLEKVRQNVQRDEGAVLTEITIRNWLSSAGFRPEGNGRTWIVNAADLIRLDESEIIRCRSVA